MGNPKVVSLSEYQRMENDLEGICLDCGTTVSGVEGDAEDYNCPSCDGNRVQGIQDAMVDGNILIEGAEGGFL